MALKQRYRNLLTAAAVFAAACSCLAWAAMTEPAAAATVPEWIISSHAIGLIKGYTGNTTLTTNAFDAPSTAEIGTPAAGWVSKREFVTTASKHGYQAILAPSIDLTKGMACNKTADAASKNYLTDCSVPQIVADAK